MARGREEGRAARLYTVSLLLLAATWSPLYTLATVQVSTLDISTYLHIYIFMQALTQPPPHLAAHLPPLVTAAATLYAPLSALLHGYRNTKVRKYCR